MTDKQKIEDLLAQLEAAKTVNAELQAELAKKAPSNPQGRLPSIEVDGVEYEIKTPKFYLGGDLIDAKNISQAQAKALLAMGSNILKTKNDKE